VDIRTPEQLGLARRLVSAWATELAFPVVDRTKFVTAASELGRNMLVHGRGGIMRIEELVSNARSGLQLVFADQGPGIADIEQALVDGFSTARSMGVGLGGGGGLWAPPPPSPTNSRSTASPGRARPSR
jgi:serine/threonine-protein kinase RsbT